MDARDTDGWSWMLLRQTNVMTERSDGQSVLANGARPLA
jgi:hypothetical protein